MTDKEKVILSANLQVYSLLFGFFSYICSFLSPTNILGDEAI